MISDNIETETKNPQTSALVRIMTNTVYCADCCYVLNRNIPNWHLTYTKWKQLYGGNLWEEDRVETICSNMVEDFRKPNLSPLQIEKEAWNYILLSQVNRRALSEVQHWCWFLSVVIDNVYAQLTYNTNITLQSRSVSRAQRLTNMCNADFFYRRSCRSCSGHPICSVQ